jgi:hypothetical protein
MIYPTELRAHLKIIAQLSRIIFARFKIASKWLKPMPSVKSEIHADKAVRAPFRLVAEFGVLSHHTM